MEFTPYAIDCITCGTRLKVTDPSLVGQITFCLKCQSMVEVTPPPVGDVTAGESAAAVPRGNVDLANGFDNLEISEPAADVAEPPVANEPAGEPPRQPQSKTVGRSERAVAEMPPVVPELPVTDAAASAPPASPHAVTPPPAWQAGNLQMPAAPEPTWRKQLTIGLSAFTGVALAVAAWVFWSMGHSGDDAASTAQRISPLVAVQRVEPRAANAGDEEAAPTDNDRNNPSAAAKPPGETEPDETTPRPLPDLPVETEPGSDEEQAATAVDEPKQPPTDPAQPPQVAAAGGGTTDSLANSPFDFDFENPLPPELVKANPRPEVEPVDAAPKPVPQPPAPSAEIRQLLTTTVPAIQTPANRPLTLERFADFVSQLIGRRVWIDPLALEATGVTPQSAVYLNSREVTVDELLRDALARYGLSYLALGDTILIVAEPAEQARRREVRFRIGDLAENTVGMQRFAHLVREIIAPESWSTVGGPASVTVDGDSLLVDHGAAERYQVLVLCEKLRVARGMAPKSRYEPSRFDVAARSVQAKPSLGKTVSFEAGEAVPLNVILGQLAYQSGVDLQVDHLALLSANLSESMAADLSVLDQPLEQALQELLEPLDLVYYPLGANRLVVTTPYAMQRTMLWEVFAVPANLTTVSDVDQWMDQLRDGVQRGTWDAAGGSGRMAFDRGSRFIVVRQNPAVLAELAEQLGT